MSKQFKSLRKADVAKSPFDQFSQWFTVATACAQIDDAAAMSLTTVASDGKPSSRMVGLRGFDDNGFVFFTNYTSRKAQEIATNDNAALLFWWQQLDQQIRIEGKLEQVSAAESDKYYASRPRDAQISAWASEQSSVVPNREYLEQRYQQQEQQFADKTVPRPNHWGGYRLVPDRFEFWQRGAHRFHHRLVYRLQNGMWLLERLAP